jgi:PqqD family protein of HPr-rel-A system
MREPVGASVDSDRLLPTRGVTLEQVGAEGILHDENGGQVHVLNASATRVWELCAERLTLSELIASLAQTYELPAAAVRDDVLAIIRDFLARGLIEPRGRTHTESA